MNTPFLRIGLLAAVLFVADEGNAIAAVARATVGASGASATRILSPLPWQVFAPGDTVQVLVEIDPSLGQAAALVSSILGFEILGTPPFAVSFTIPIDLTGPVTLSTGAITVAQEDFEGDSVTIMVVPTDAPQQFLMNQMYTFTLPLEANARATRIAPAGIYAGGVQRDISDPVTGTTYTSSDSAIVVVDAQGYLTPIAPGTTIVTTQNRGVKAFTVVDVEQRGIEIPPVDLTARVNIVRGGLRLDSDTGFFVQQLQVTNVSSTPLVTPLVLALTDLSNRVRLTNWNGFSVNITPAGSPFVTVPVSSDGLTLPPGKTITLLLKFASPTEQAIAYTPRLFRAEHP
jgi:hypothetical protein